MSRVNQVKGFVTSRNGIATIAAGAVFIVILILIGSKGSCGSNGEPETTTKTPPPVVSAADAGVVNLPPIVASSTDAGPVATPDTAVADVLDVGPADSDDYEVLVDADPAAAPTDAGKTAVDAGPAAAPDAGPAEVKDSATGVPCPPGFKCVPEQQPGSDLCCVRCECVVVDGGTALVRPKGYEAHPCCLERCNKNGQPDGCCRHCPSGIKPEGFDGPCCLKPCAPKRRSGSTRPPPEKTVAETPPPKDEDDDCGEILVFSPSVTITRGDKVLYESE